MSTEYLDPRVSFFDDLAERWDGFEDLQALAGRLAEGLRHFQVRPDERILEVGCGTGNLTSALCRHLSQAGRIVAVDCSARMLERARAKVTDGRVTWIHAHLQDLPRDGAAFDGVAFDKDFGVPSAGITDGVRATVSRQSIVSRDGSYAVEYSGFTPGQADFSLYSTDGSLKSRRTVSLSESAGTFEWKELSSLPRGIYLVRVKSGDKVASGGTFFKP